MTPGTPAGGRRASTSCARTRTAASPTARSYDLQFQHWLTQTNKLVDLYGDEDIEAFADANALRASYDLIVFPGHTEYVTGRTYNLIQGYRDLGGNLLFLSANNFFRRIDRSNSHIKLIDEWRDLGRPEEALLGVRYVASDRGQRHAPFTVVGADIAPWAFSNPGSTTAPSSGRTGSRSTRAAPLRRRTPRCSRRSRTCSARDAPPR